MYEIIEKGYLYIAQPPLYKAKKGKKEIYLKDEESLITHLLNEGTEGVTVKADDESKVWRGKQIIPALRTIIEYKNIFDKFVHKGFNASFLKRMIEGQIENGFTESGDIAMLAKAVTDKYSDITVEVYHDPDRAIFIIDGIRIRIDSSLIEDIASHDFKLLRNRYQAIVSNLGMNNFEISNETMAEKVVETYEDLLSFFIERGKKGIYIQRYKGLGEMNPDQLWETTMDPEKRVLLQVKIEDAVEADAIFTVLMGDQVEPRREFIERNALQVSNLDI
jgi:DNA gyrase subunit B